MIQHTTRETAADALFDQIWAELVGQLDASAAMVGLNHDRFRWLLPELVHLLDDSGDTSTEPLDAIVRIRVVDCLFIEDSGDPVLPPAYEAVVDQLVAVLTETLVRLRQQAIEAGQCSSGRDSTPLCR